MWKCKECGEKIQGYYTGLVDIDKNGWIELKKRKKL